MNINFIPTVILAISSLCISTVVAQEPAPSAPTKVLIGTYDSRAIAVAWAASKFNPVGEKKKEYEAAKLAGDKSKIAELEQWGPRQQRLLHFQGFGRVPVSDLLKPVQVELESLMSQKKLVAITMQCEAISDQVQVVDVTMDLVQLFQPTQKTIDTVKQLVTKAPISLLELSELPADK